jgi:hypothetical protein
VARLGEIHDPRPRAMLRGATPHCQASTRILDRGESVRLGACARRTYEPDGGAAFQVIKAIEGELIALSIVSDP